MRGLVNPLMLQESSAFEKLHSLKKKIIEILWNFWFYRTFFDRINPRDGWTLDVEVSIYNLSRKELRKCFLIHLQVN